jgi:hypothetical protein
MHNHRDGNLAARINVAIASPTDVREERDVVPKVFLRWNSARSDAILHPEMWEHSAVPALGGHPQKILNKQIIDKSELLIAIFWSRLGTPTPDAESGTVEEIEEFIEAKGAARVMLYFCTRDIRHDIDLEELQRLRDYKETMKTRGLYQEYSTPADFENKLYPHIDAKVHEFLDGKLPIPEKSPVQEVEKSRKLHADSRLNKEIEFGGDLESIIKELSRRMDAFDAIQGGGSNKFIDLACHVYTCCANSLDGYLASPGKRKKTEEWEPFDRISARLKYLASRASEYPKGIGFEEYFNEGRVIKNDLQSAYKHLKRMQDSAWKNK